MVNLVVYPASFGHRPEAADLITRPQPASGQTRDPLIPSPEIAPDARSGRFSRGHGPENQGGMKCRKRVLKTGLRSENRASCGPRPTNARILRSARRRAPSPVRAAGCCSARRHTAAGRSTGATRALSGGRPTAGQYSRVSPRCPVSPEQANHSRRTGRRGGPGPRQVPAPSRSGAAAPRTASEWNSPLRITATAAPRRPCARPAAKAGLIAARLFLCRPASVPRILRWRMHENIPTVPYQSPHQSPPGTLSCADCGFRKHHGCILVCQVTPRTA